MILIAGLGNPGSQYNRTKHNIGFMFIDALIEKLRLSDEFQKKFDSFCKGIDLKGEKIILVKPQTFMNLSGKAVQAFMTFYKLKLDDIWVVHDDIDLEIGVVKVKKGGGHAGHNGLRDIDAKVGKEYHRIRIGIGRPKTKEEVSSYVLTAFKENEKNIIDESIQKAIDLWLAEGLSSRT